MLRRTKIITIILLLAVMSAHSGHAADEPNNTYEARAVNAFLLYCLPALTAGDSVSRVAEMQKLPELQRQAENAFLKGRPGKVFGLPAVGPGIVLSAPDVPMCSIIIQKVDAQEFIKQVDYWFDPTHSPWRMDSDTSKPNGEVERKYNAQIHSVSLLTLVNVRSEPIPGGIQAMLTVGRTGY